MRVAIVHDWLTGMRGGERVLEELLELYPDAEIFTLLHDRGSVSKQIEDRPIHTAWVDRLPRRGKGYRFLLPFFPKAIERFEFERFDLILSSSHCVAKGVKPARGVAHLCYCHTPMRYIWDQYDHYFGPGRASLPVRLGMAALAPRLRAWDVRTASTVDHFVANSQHVRRRIQAVYGRDAVVVHPPVDLHRFQVSRRPREDFFLTLGALVPYKRVDRAIQAFNMLGERLLVVGSGGDRGRLIDLAGPTVEVTGWLPEAEVTDLLGRCRALVLPGVEDFGIGVVEALASGTPIIALADGGVLDSVRDVESPEGEVANGVLFSDATPAGLASAVERFHDAAFDPEVVAASARPFSPERFRDGMAAEIERLLCAWPNRLDGSMPE